MTGLWPLFDVGGVSGWMERPYDKVRTDGMDDLMAECYLDGGAMAL